MYNRYIPQADGTYRRSAQQDRTMHPEQRQNTKGQNIDPPRSQPEVGRAPVPGARPCHQDRDQHKKHCSPPAPPKPEPYREPTRSAQTNVMTFLRRLLPREFDTGDLLIVLLILLMAGDCREEQNTALLTLVLYLFL
mgnify:CR=1 FL=1